MGVLAFDQFVVEEAVGSVLFSHCFELCFDVFFVSLMHGHEVLVGADAVDFLVE